MPVAAGPCGIVGLAEELELCCRELGNGFDDRIPRVVVDHAFRLRRRRSGDGLCAALPRTAELEHQQSHYRE